MVRALQSQRLIQRKRKLLVWKLIGVCFVLVALVGLPALLTHASFLSIDTVTVENAAVVSQEEIETLVKNKLEGNYWYLFAKTNALLYPRKKIENEIVLQYPRVKKADLELVGLKKISVHIEERVVKALWCDETRQCFAMDENGFIFDEAPEFSADVYPVYGSPQRENPIGGYFLDGENYIQVLQYRDGLVRIGLTPQRIFVEHAEYAKAFYENGRSIVFSLKDNPAVVLSNLESVMRDENVGAFIDGKLSVARIDLRYGNKVILQKDTNTE
jgi:hypothetical protein